MVPTVLKDDIGSSTACLSVSLWIKHTTHGKLLELLLLKRFVHNLVHCYLFNSTPLPCSFPSYLGYTSLSISPALHSNGQPSAPPPSSSLHHLSLFPSPRWALVCQYAWGAGGLGLGAVVAKSIGSWLGNWKVTSSSPGKTKCYRGVPEQGTVPYTAPRADGAHSHGRLMQPI